MTRRTHLIFLLDSSPSVSPVLPAIPETLEQVELLLKVGAISDVVAGQGQDQGQGEDKAQRFDVSVVSYKDENNLLKCCWKQNTHEISKFIKNLCVEEDDEIVSVQKSPFIHGNNENNNNINKNNNSAIMQQQNENNNDVVVEEGLLNRSFNFKEKLAIFQSKCDDVENSTKSQNQPKNMSSKNDNVYLHENFYICSGSAEVASDLNIANNSQLMGGSGEGSEWQSGLGSSFPANPTTSRQETSFELSKNSYKFESNKYLNHNSRAQKTALNEIFRKCCKDDEQVIVFHFTDACPYALLTNNVGGKQRSAKFGGVQQLPCRGMLEKNILDGRNPGFDWVKICKQFRSAHIQVFTFSPASAINIQYLNQFHLMLGTVVRLPSFDIIDVTQSTMSVMLKLTGQQILANENIFNSDILQFSQKSISKLSKLKNEGNCYGWLTPHGNLRCSVNSKGNINLVKELKIDLLNVANIVKFDPNTLDNFKSLLKKLFNQKNISPILCNPVFCQLFLEISREKEMQTFEGIFDEFIPDEMRQNFRSHVKEWQQLCGGNNPLKLQCPFKPKSKVLYPDFKMQCTKCARFRSFTLMDGGKCGQCRSFENENFENCVPESSSVIIEEVLDVNFVSSFRECVDCHGFYAVIKDVNCVPRCHYCRNGSKPPLLKCAQCTNSYIVPDGDQSRPSPFTCPPCLYQPQHYKQITNTNLKALTNQNPIIPFYFYQNDNIKITNLIKDMITLYQIYLNQNQNTNLNSCNKNMNQNSQQKIVFNGKQILNQEDVFNQVGNIFDRYNSLETCLLCCNEFKNNQLLRACGKCSNVICETCLKNWYSVTQPGKLVLVSNLSCPFCRQIPKPKILKQFNNKALKLVSQIHKNNQIRDEPGSSHNVDNAQNTKFRDDMYYGWCQCCNKVKEAMERTCAGDNLPVLNGFNCEDCQLNEEINLDKVKRCPGCSAPSVKVTGCVHIECTICGTHWCYLCQKTFEDVYEHMDNDHDSAEAYPDDDYEDEDYDEY